MGRPDYDVGDLVVCVKTVNPDSPNLGRVFTVVALWPPVPGQYKEWDADVKELPPKPGYRGWLARCFHKIDPKPPEFWTGDVEVENREPAHAG